MVLNSDFYRGKNVLVTGHTGFKGIWLCKLLELLGANVTGYALPSPTEEGKNVFQQSGTEVGMNSIIGDVRDLPALQRLLLKLSQRLFFIWRLSLLCWKVIAIL